MQYMTSTQTTITFTQLVDSMVDHEAISHAADMAIVDCIPEDADEETLERMLGYLAPVRETIVDRLTAQQLLS